MCSDAQGASGRCTCSPPSRRPRRSAASWSTWASGPPRSPAPPPAIHVAMWDEIKAAASEAILAGGGTITHHHAVGRDHRPWYDRERPDLFAAALKAAKGVLDPNAIMNPGVLV